jgi:hypothetical protein
MVGQGTRQSRHHSSMPLLLLRFVGNCCREVCCSIFLFNAHPRVDPLLLLQSSSLQSTTASPMRVDLGALVALFGRGRTFASTSGGFGLAACPSLGLLVISDTNASALHVFELPRLGQADASKGLLRLCILHANS